jgi:hypothetical protein
VFCDDHPDLVTIRGLELVDDGYCFEPTPQGTAAVHAALRERFLRVPNDGLIYTACTKLDLLGDSGGERSLNVSVRRLTDEAIVALPGKMTEAPFVADHVARSLFGSMGGASSVALRPMDAM